MITKENLETFLNGYYETMFWAEWDSLQEQEIGELELSESAKHSSRQDALSFLQSLPNDVLRSLDFSQAGHDFWLTRNGHGAGFWDGDYDSEVEAALMTACKPFGPVHLYADYGFLQVEQ